MQTMLIVNVNVFVWIFDMRCGSLKLQLQPGVHHAPHVHGIWNLIYLLVLLFVICYLQFAICYLDMFVCVCVCALACGRVFVFCVRIIIINTISDISSSSSVLGFGAV